MNVTPRLVRAAYHFFRFLPPYSRWNLPDEVEFRITKRPDVYGTYQLIGGRHRITISRRNVKTLHALIVTLAHELIHLRQELTGDFSDRSQHNRAFVRASKHVCRALGFDSAGFV